MQDAADQLAPALAGQGDAQVATWLAEIEGMLATAESCTGGLIAAILTAIAGASDVLERGYVTYSNDAKHECLGVPMPLIAAARQKMKILKLETS